MQIRSILAGLCTLSACAVARAPDSETNDALVLAQQAAPPSSPGLTTEPADDAALGVFDAREIKTYALTLAPEDLAKLDAQPAAEKYVRATLAVDGESLPVAVRYKGSVGAFMAPCTAGGFSRGPKTGKCSFKIAFDEYDPDARFHGLKKLNLHSMNNDPSLLLERLSYGLFREMGVAASRAMHVRVTVNGKLEGLFLAVEEIDGRFTRARFPEDGKGNVYKEVWPMHADARRYQTALETNKAAGKVDKMVAFKRAIDADPASAVATYLDRDYMLRYLAVDRVIMNDDGPFHLYCFGPVFYNHNFYWYEQEKADRMWLLPWDIDHALGTGPETLITPAWWQPTTDCSCRAGRGGLPNLPGACEPLIKVFGTWKADYDAAVDTLLRGPFSQAEVDAKLSAWSAQIAPHVRDASALPGGATEAAWRSGIDRLRAEIDSLRRNRGYKYP
ncbi:MAG: CotH kinase family protein [Polyangiales bacterium]